MSQTVRLTHKHPGHPDQSVHNPKGGGGAGGGSSLSSSESGASINRHGTDLRVNDESVSGTVIIETNDDFDTEGVSEADVRDYVSADAAMDSYGAKAGSALAGNIASTKIKGVTRGKGYLSVDVEFELETPLSEVESESTAAGLDIGTLGLTGKGKQRSNAMPKPKPGESQDDYVSRCIPMVINEGTTDDSSQAAAICHSMWRDNQKSKEGIPSLETRTLRLTAKAAKAGGWWVTQKQMEGICPSCAEKMRDLGYDRLNLLKLKQMPEPLKTGLCAKFGPDPGLFTECMESSLGDFDPSEQEAYCAWLHHECTGEWPGEHREEAKGSHTKKEINLVERFVMALTGVMEKLTGKEESLDAFRDRVYRAFSGQYAPSYGNNPWVMEVYPTYAIVCSGEEYFRVPFAQVDGDVTFAMLNEWVPVERRQEWIEKAAMLAKEGRRHSAKDQGALQSIHDNAVTLGAECPMITKGKDGRWRWVMLSSNAYEDTDGEIVSLKALQDDVDRADLTGDYGVLDWWHVPMLRLGVADFNAMHGNVLVESGTFHNERIGGAVAQRIKELQGSLTFFHPADEPDAEGVFHHIRRAARGLLPKGRAANILTALPAVTKETNMPTLKEKWTEFVGLLGGDEQLAKSVVSSAEAVEKQANELKLRHKQQSQTAGGGAGNVTSVTTPAPTAQVQVDTPATTAASDGQQVVTDFADVLKAVLQPVLTEMQSIKERLDAQTSKEAGDQAARAKQITDLQAQIKTHQDALAGLDKTLKELTGEQPRGAGGFRPSQSPETILAPKDKEALESATTPTTPSPVDAFMAGLGLGVPSGAGG